MRFFPLFRLGLVAGGLLSAPLLTHAQTGSIGIGTATPNAKAALDITSADKGLLIPRLTPAARRAIGAPPQGMLVFQTGAATVPTDSVGIWYATGQSRRWLYLPDAQQSQVTTTNGLTKTGTTVALGGTLTQPTTTVDARLNSELLLQSEGLGAPVLDQVVQGGTSSSTALSRSPWQSFTPSVSSYLTHLDVRLDVLTVGSLTGTLYEGEGTGGAVLATLALTTTATGSALLLSLPLPAPLPVTAGRRYTLALTQTGGSHRWNYGLTNPGGPYAGGKSSVGSLVEFRLATYQATLGPQQGVRLASGAVQLTGLSGPALLDVAADGTVGTRLLQNGSVVVGPGPASGFATVAVVFPTAYPTAPGTVVCSARSEAGTSFNDTFSVTVRSVSAAGFVANVKRVDGGNLWGQNLLLNWIVMP